MFEMIFCIVSITISGNSPTDVSPLSITASAPSKTELATSFTSARVGRGVVIMLSNICVAIITGFEAALHFFTIIFCSKGTSSRGISTPKSPRATIIASETAMISSIFSIASGFSILATTLAVLPLALIISFNSVMSSALRTKDKPIHSTLFSKTKSKFFLSSAVNDGMETLVFGKLTPFREVKIPP